MRRERVLFVGSIVLGLAGVGTVIVLGLLGKEGRPHGRMFHGKVEGDLAYLALVVGPLLGLGTLGARWRCDRLVAAAGAGAMAVAVGAIVWGNTIDYLEWRSTPPPQDQIEYLGAFFGALGAWVVCLAYAMSGVVTRFLRRRLRVTAA